VMGIRRRRRKRLQEDLEGRRRYCKSKDEGLNGNLRTCRKTDYIMTTVVLTWPPRSVAHTRCGITGEVTNGPLYDVMSCYLLLCLVRSV
jgi:hypothetical protein